jgi:hypothetical protein
LRRSRKTGHFSSQLKVPSAQPAAYPGHFPQRAHIPAVFGAKFAAIRPFRALFAVQGLPSPEQGLPSAKTAQKQKRRNGKPHSAIFSQAHIPAVFRAKFTAIRPFRALFAAQGLPSSEQGLPLPMQGLPSVRAAQKQKRRNGKPPFRPSLYRFTKRNRQRIPC